MIVEISPEQKKICRKNPIVPEQKPIEFPVEVNVYEFLILFVDTDKIVNVIKDWIESGTRGVTTHEDKELTKTLTVSIGNFYPFLIKLEIDAAF